MKTCLAAIAVSLSLIASPIAGATDTTVTVSGPWITLGDVADASGPLALVRVAPSPAPGETLALDPVFVGKVARSNGVYFPSDHSGPIRVSRMEGASVSVSSASTSSTSTPANPAPRRAIPPDNVAPRENMVLVTTRDAKRGDILTASDLMWETAPSNQGQTTGMPRLKTEVVGKQVRRTLRSGRAFRMSDIETPALIAKGDPVTLIYSTGGLMLTVSGRALTDAAANEPVRIMNNYSKRAIDAVATGAGEAHVRQN